MCFIIERLMNIRPFLTYWFWLYRRRPDAIQGAGRGGRGGRGGGRGGLLDAIASAGRGGRGRGRGGGGGRAGLL